MRTMQVGSAFTGASSYACAASAAGATCIMIHLKLAQYIIRLRNVKQPLALPV